MTLLDIVMGLVALSAPPDWLQKEADTLQADLGLKYELHVADCGDENAFYYPTLDTVVICSELLDRPALATFILKHETGHALMDQWDVPQVDPEGGADDVAHLLATPEELTAGALWFMAIHKENPELDREEHHHPRPLDRAWSALCWLPDSETRACRVHRREVLAAWRRLAILLAPE